MKKPLTLSYGNIVIGSSLEAFIFAYYCRTKCLWTRQLQPLMIDEFDNDFGIGKNKWKAWNKYCSTLGLSGATPFENKITSIKVVEPNLLRVTTFDKGWYFIKFNNIIVFDDHELYGLEPHTGITDSRLQLIDHLRVKGYEIGDLKNITKRKPYMERIYSFEKRKQKEILVFSTIEESKLEDRPDYLVKIHLETVLQDRIKTKTAQSIQHLNRIIRPLGRNIYADTETIMFMYKSAEELYRLALPSYDPSYLHYLDSRLNLKCEKTYQNTLQELSPLPPLL